ncbi:MAG: nucleoid-associated protein [Salinarimonas sp.]|nr:nucleoid-associated protein [Salinarimonas sp.]
MIFENLNINRVVVHEIFQRKEDRVMIEPAYAGSLENLSAAAMGAFRLRITDALSAQTQSLEMDIIKFDKSSFLAIAEAMVDQSDEDFLDQSKLIAAKLADAQKMRRIPGGMLVVFDGSVGYPSIPFVGVIKAETQEGFRRSRTGENVVVEFLQNIFLTPATRLYKIGIFLFHDISKEKPSGRQAYIFDSNISAKNRENAAIYFYDGFLGCAFPSDGAYETQRFFDLTKEFIQKSNISSEDKRGLNDSLYVFIRNEQEPTFTTNQFSDRYMPEILQPDYLDYMERKNFKTSAVYRDTSAMGNRLRRRRLGFGADIELRASPEALEKQVRIEPIVGEDGGIGGWTQIIIKDRYTGDL